MADRGLSIAGEFAGFGPDIMRLRKRLRGAGVDLHDSFPPYGAQFRRQLGIKNEQAMELFHQTVSMKSVGNLTDFVRDHMLEPFDVAPRIAALIAHFEDLNRAHEAVLKAKRQVELLAPLMADCARHDELSSRSDALRGCREALRAYFARLKAELLTKRLRPSGRRTGGGRHEIHAGRLEAQRAAQAKEIVELRRAIADSGGDRLERLSLEIRPQGGGTAAPLGKEPALRRTAA